ncbi:MAG: hypothetical protein Kow0062_26450 [Acidobacteriota bacterium]
MEATQTPTASGFEGTGAVSLLGRAVTLGDSVLARLTFLPPLLTRIMLGYGFYMTGTGKFRYFENTVEFFSGLGIPFPTLNAGLVASMETFGGIALILGLGTRFFSAGLSITMVVALLTADRADFLSSWLPSSDNVPADITAFVYLLFLLWLLVSGAGAVSLDRLLGRVFRLPSFRTRLSSGN